MHEIKLEDGRTIERPLAFIYDDLYWCKEFDGLYHGYLSPTHRKHWERYQGSYIRTMTIGDVDRLALKSVVAQPIWYFSDDINKKL